MDAVANLFPPGTDLCQIPIGVPPKGQAPDFNDVGLKSLTIAFSVILTAIAIAFAFGRLVANARKLGLSDREFQQSKTTRINSPNVMIGVQCLFYSLLSPTSSMQFL